MYVFCLSQRRDKERETRDRDKVPRDVRRRNQDARPLRALIRSLEKCETRSVHACERAQKKTQGV